MKSLSQAASLSFDTLAFVGGLWVAFDVVANQIDGMDRIVIAVLLLASALRGVREIAARMWPTP